MISFLDSRARGGEAVMHSITLTWTASPSPDVIGYYLYSGEHSGDYTSRIDVGNQTTFDIPNLIEGTTYFFTVTAYQADGNESLAASEFHYLPNPAVLLNLSTRAQVGTADNVMIAGFIVGGTGQKKMMIRALGPTLLYSGVNGVLRDPILEIYGPNGLIATNDNWVDGDTTQITAFNLAPFFNEESAAIVTLAPGAYSAIVRGRNNTTGIALLEVYDVGPADPP